MRNPQWHEMPDEALLEAARLGDAEPFATLWERHRRAGIVAARSLAPGLEADDLVADAYLKILDLVLDGRGPRGAFRPYLYQTIKTIAADRFRAPDRGAADLDEAGEPHEAGPGDDGAFDLAAVTRAFASLEPRWQSVLWYTEVEGLPPREAAKLLGISPNGVSALARRAREGLRSAWVEAHVNHELAAEECRTTLERLQRFQRGKLTSRASREVAAHLDRCESCTNAAAEFASLNRQLALVLATLFVGGGAAALLGAGTGVSAPAAAAVLPLGGGGSTGSPGSGGASGSGASGSGAAGASGAGTAAAGAGAAGALGVVGLSAAAAAAAIWIGVAILAPSGDAPATTAAASTGQHADSSSGSQGGSGGAETDSTRENGEAQDRQSEATATTTPSRALPAAPQPVAAPDRGLPAEPPNGPAEPEGNTEPPGPGTTDPTGPDDPTGPAGPTTLDGDPSLLPGYECTLAGAAMMGSTSEYGLLRLRATAPGGTPVEIVPSIYDPAAEGIVPGNVFSDGLFADPFGNTFDFGFFTGTDPGPGFNWWGPDPETLPQWQAAFPGLAPSDVTLEIRLVSPDGRYSPWTVIDPGITCW